MFLIEGENLFHGLEVRNASKIHIELHTCMVLGEFPELKELRRCDWERLTEEDHIYW
jgi:hypothetical protein